ncbi:MAG: ATP-binding protein [Planctomycetota bacterium]
MNLAAFSVLAAAVLRDADVRRAARQQHQAELRDQYVGLAKDLFVSFFEEFDFDQLNMRTLIDASYWEYARDAYISSIVSNLGEGVVPGDIGLNPAGSDGLEERVQYRERALELMARAYETREVQPEGDLVAFPLYEGSGEDRRKWGAAYVRVAVPSPPEEPPVLGVETVALALGGATLAAMGLVFLLMHLLVLMPLGRISEGAGRVSQGDFASPVPVTGSGDEIDRLILSFNAMVAEIGQKREALEHQVDEVVERMRLTEKRLVLTDRLAAMGTLAAGIAHEINNPLGGMLNAVATLRRRGELPESTHRYLALVEDGLSRIRDVVLRVLRFSPGRQVTGKVRLGEVVEDAVRFIGYRLKQADAALEVDLEPDLTVQGDPAALGQVFLNLLLNASYALEAPPRRIRILARREEDEISIRVSDTGRGMTNEERRQAFNLFYTTREAGKGTGLGLSIVHQIITDHRGSVSIESEFGSGTEILIRLPAVS